MVFKTILTPRKFTLQKKIAPSPKTSGAIIILLNYF